MMATQPLPLSTPGRNLVRLTIVRGITWTGFLAGIIFGLEILHFQLNVLAVFSVILTMAGGNILTWWRLGIPRPVSDTEYLLHLLFDVCGLCLLFFFTGGASNPFISYFLIPITISAATLPWLHTWIIAATALASYTILMFFNHPVPQLEHVRGAGLSLHIFGMWANFLLSAGLITVFLFKMAHALRQRDAALAQTREQALRDDQIMAIATQAAGTAHELGTPLSTMAVMLSEMRNEHDEQDPIQDDLALLQQQIATCKQTLKSLVHNTDRSRLGKNVRLPLDEFIEVVIERWNVLRPDIHYSLTWSGEVSEMPDLNADITLQQSLLNLLNNAADASQDKPVDIKVRWKPQQAKLEIHDHGPGIPMEIAERLGETFVSTKSKGLGLGLFLTHATINRIGGSVRLFNHDEGGTLTEVRLPVTKRQGAPLADQEEHHEPTAG
ncbi:two-component sensor histidine kinase [Terasakiispira papahanaumokuakeensis]|uniref:histidine kinase n=1 Tax=Terasakiispira papahanaumokuakeensis TaxID=197479 RepID=A0A1E2V8F8_9GAMM|nr:ATP-binding protein [Terasakiispira papahanaumokuakeensis]ODC03290.1 two-component sensor histidine kinase [Terasakiispira papahanaumokuakeensis]